VKPFCMLCSIKLLAVRTEYIALRRHHANTLSGIDSSVIGRNFEGILVLHFLGISIVQALFHSLGMDPESQTARISSVK
jgi:hypothetical protein